MDKNTKHRRSDTKNNNNASNTQFQASKKTHKYSHLYSMFSDSELSSESDTVDQIINVTKPDINKKKSKVFPVQRKLQQIENEDKSSTQKLLKKYKLNTLPPAKKSDETHIISNHLYHPLHAQSLIDNKIQILPSEKIKEGRKKEIMAKAKFYAFCYGLEYRDKIYNSNVCFIQPKKKFILPSITKCDYLKEQKMFYIPPVDIDLNANSLLNTYIPSNDIYQSSLPLHLSVNRAHLEIYWPLHLVVDQYTNKNSSYLDNSNTPNVFGEELDSFLATIDKTQFSCVMPNPSLDHEISSLKKNKRFTQSYKLVPETPLCSMENPCYTCDLSYYKASMLVLRVDHHTKELILNNPYEELSSTQIAPPLTTTILSSMSITNSYYHSYDKMLSHPLEIKEKALLQYNLLPPIKYHTIVTTVRMFLPGHYVINVSFIIITVPFYNLLSPFSSVWISQYAAILLQYKITVVQNFIFYRVTHTHSKYPWDYALPFSYYDTLPQVISTNEIPYSNLIKLLINVVYKKSFNNTFSISNVYSQSIDSNDDCIFLACQNSLYLEFNVSNSSTIKKQHTLLAQFQSNIVSMSIVPISSVISHHNAKNLNGGEQKNEKNNKEKRYFCQIFIGLRSGALLCGIYDFSNIDKPKKLHFAHITSIPSGYVSNINVLYNQLPISRQDHSLCILICTISPGLTIQSFLTCFACNAFYRTIDLSSMQNDKSFQPCHGFTHYIPRLSIKCPLLQKISQLSIQNICSFDNNVPFLFLDQNIKSSDILQSYMYNDILPLHGVIYSNGNKVGIFPPSNEHIHFGNKIDNKSMVISVLSNVLCFPVLSLSNIDNNYHNTNEMVYHHNNIVNNAYKPIIVPIIDQYSPFNLPKQKLQCSWEYKLCYIIKKSKETSESSVITTDTNERRLYNINCDISHFHAYENGLCTNKSLDFPLFLSLISYYIQPPSYS